MDADYDPTSNLEDGCADSAKLKRRRKRKSKFAAVVQKPKPTFEHSEKSFGEYLQEYYELDSLVTGERFKYRKVVPNNFGLSTDEVSSKFAKCMSLNLSIFLSLCLSPLSLSLHSLSFSLSHTLPSLSLIRSYNAETRN